MNLLAFDTSSANLSVSILLKGKIVNSHNCCEEYAASKLIVQISALLQKLNVKLSDFDMLCLGAGPGSFTGLRISFSVAKALSYALNLPVVCVGSFYSMAYAYKNDHQKIAVISDARKGLIYACTFISKKGKLVYQEREKLAALDTFVKTHRDHLFLTYDMHLKAPSLQYISEGNFCLKPVYPDAKNILELGISQYNKARLVKDKDIAPLYIHPKTCQIRTKMK